MYPVCPDRNVVSAFRCFLGPDSRGIERFFGDGRLYWANDALYTVHVQGRSALAGAVRRFESAASLVTATAVCARFLLYRVKVVLRRRSEHAASVIGRWAAHYRLPPVLDVLAIPRHLLHRTEVHHPIERRAAPELRLRA